MPLPAVPAELQSHGGLLATVVGPLFAGITQLVSQGGYGGVFLAMLVENFLQFIPSEAIMPLAGYLVFTGKLQLLPTILAGTAGTIAGTLPWYLIGRLVNTELLEAQLDRHGAWFGITPGKLRHARHWFQRYGAWVVFWGRLVPILRTLISIPAGIEMMPWRPFLLWTSLGSLLWNALDLLPEQPDSKALAMSTGTRHVLRSVVLVVVNCAKQPAAASMIRIVIRLMLFMALFSCALIGIS